MDNNPETRRMLAEHGITREDIQRFYTDDPVFRETYNRRMASFLGGNYDEHLNKQIAPLRLKYKNNAEGPGYSYMINDPSEVQWSKSIFRQPTRPGSLGEAIISNPDADAAAFRPRGGGLSITQLEDMYNKGHFDGFVEYKYGKDAYLTPRRGR